MAEYFHPFGKYLTEEEQQTNAAFFAAYLLEQGWTMEAICGALGNWESECTLNPNLPQHVDTYPNGGGGFGLAQWTPYKTKIHWYADQKGITPTTTDDNPAGDFFFQIEFHEFDCTFGHQGTGSANWFGNKGYKYSWEEYKKSEDHPSILATAYYWQYERSAANDPGSRPNNAKKWYEYLTGIVLPDVDIGGETKKKTLSKLLLFAVGSDLI